MKLLRIGEIAKKAGVSVRTLHHYDEIGLLRPGHVNNVGHRFYNAIDIERLEQIVFMKSLGFSLDEISACLANKHSNFSHALSIQEQVIAQKIASLNKVSGLLRFMLARLKNKESTDTKELFFLIKEINDMEHSFTPEQLKKLQERYEKYPEKAREVEQAWPILFKQFEEAMKAGLDPSCKEVQKLAEQAQIYIDLFTGQDKEIEARLDQAYEQNQENALKTWGVSKEVFEFATQARKIFNS